LLLLLLTPELRRSKVENNPAVPIKKPLAAPPLPKFEVVDNKLTAKSVADGDCSWVDQLSHVLGIKDKDAVTSLLGFFVSANFKVTPSNCMGINSVLAQVAEMGPRDPAETMLSMQMVTCHAQIMNLMAHVTQKETALTSEAGEISIKLAERLMRIYTKQMETLSQYRRKGEQKMIVEHITVNNGGQAIVGNLNKGCQGE